MTHSLLIYHTLRVIIDLQGTKSPFLFHVARFHTKCVKGEDMNLYELGVEYEKRAIELTNHIHALNKTLSRLTGERKTAMRRRIYLLYTDAAECRKQAKKLKEYYDRRNING